MGKHAIRTEQGRRGLSGRDKFRQAGTRGDQTGVEKIFTGGRGCENLWRGLSGKGGGVYEGQIKW